MGVLPSCYRVFWAPFLSVHSREFIVMCRNWPDQNGGERTRSSACCCCCDSLFFFREEFVPVQRKWSRRETIVFAKLGFKETTQGVGFDNAIKVRQITFVSKEYAVLFGPPSSVRYDCVPILSNENTELEGWIRRHWMQTIIANRPCFSMRTVASNFQAHIIAKKKRVHIRFHRLHDR